MPAPIKDAAREPYGARAIVYALLLDKGEAVRTRQLNQFQVYADPEIFALTGALTPPIDVLDVRFRLPIIDIAMPALKQLSAAQYRSFKDNLLALIEMDARVGLMEWSLQKILFRHLDSQFFKHAPTKTRYADFEHLTTEVSPVLSARAHAGAQDGGDGGALGAFQASLRALGSDRPTMSAMARIGVADLDRALVKLDELQPPAKSRFLAACVASIWHDRRATPPKSSCHWPLRLLWVARSRRVLRGEEKRVLRRLILQSPIFAKAASGLERIFSMQKIRSAPHRTGRRERAAARRSRSVGASCG